MYLNEKSWQEAQDDIHMIDRSLKEFLNVYRQIKKRYQDRRYLFQKEKHYICKNIRLTNG